MPPIREEKRISSCMNKSDTSTAPSASEPPPPPPLGPSVSPRMENGDSFNTPPSFRHHSGYFSSTCARSWDSPSRGRVPSKHPFLLPSTIKLPKSGLYASRPRGISDSREMLGGDGVPYPKEVKHSSDKGGETEREIFCSLSPSWEDHKTSLSMRRDHHHHPHQPMGIPPFSASLLSLIDSGSPLPPPHNQKEEQLGYTSEKPSLPYHGGEERAHIQTHQDISYSGSLHEEISHFPSDAKDSIPFSADLQILYFSSSSLRFLLYMWYFLCVIALALIWIPAVQWERYNVRGQGYSSVPSLIKKEIDRDFYSPWNETATTTTTTTMMMMMSRNNFTSPLPSRSRSTNANALGGLPNYGDSGTSPFITQWGTALAGRKIPTSPNSSLIGLLSMGEGKKKVPVDQEQQEEWQRRNRTGLPSDFVWEGDLFSFLPRPSSFFSQGSMLLERRVEVRFPRPPVEYLHQASDGDKNELHIQMVRFRTFQKKKRRTRRKGGRKTAPALASSSRLERGEVPSSFSFNSTSAFQNKVHPTREWRLPNVVLLCGARNSVYCDGVLVLPLDYVCDWTRLSGCQVELVLQGLPDGLGAYWEQAFTPLPSLALPSSGSWGMMSKTEKDTRNITAITTTTTPSTSSSSSNSSKIRMMDFFVFPSFLSSSAGAALAISQADSLPRISLFVVCKTPAYTIFMIILRYTLLAVTLWRLIVFIGVLRWTRATQEQLAILFALISLVLYLNPLFALSIYHVASSELALSFMDVHFPYIFFTQLTFLVVYLMICSLPWGEVEATNSSNNNKEEDEKNKRNNRKEWSHSENNSSNTIIVTAGEDKISKWCKSVKRVQPISSHEDASGFRLTDERSSSPEPHQLSTSPSLFPPGSCDNSSYASHKTIPTKSEAREEESMERGRGRFSRWKEWWRSYWCASVPSPFSPPRWVSLLYAIVVLAIGALVVARAVIEDRTFPSSWISSSFSSSFSSHPSLFLFTATTSTRNSSSLPHRALDTMTTAVEVESPIDRSSRTTDLLEYIIQGWIALTCLGTIALYFFLPHYFQYSAIRARWLALCFLKRFFLPFTLFLLAECVAFNAYYPLAFPSFRTLQPFNSISSLFVGSVFLHLILSTYTGTLLQPSPIPIDPSDQRWKRLVWPETWIAWVQKRGTGQYIFYSEKEERAFMALQKQYRNSLREIGRGWAPSQGGLPLLSFPSVGEGKGKVVGDRNPSPYSSYPPPCLYHSSGDQGWQCPWDSPSSATVAGGPPPFHGPVGWRVWKESLSKHNASQRDFRPPQKRDKDEKAEEYEGNMPPPPPPPPLPSQREDGGGNDRDGHLSSSSFAAAAAAAAVDAASSSSCPIPRVASSSLPATFTSLRKRERRRGPPGSMKRSQEDPPKMESPPVLELQQQQEEEGRGNVPPAFLVDITTPHGSSPSLFYPSVALLDGLRGLDCGCCGGEVLGLRQCRANTTPRKRMHHRHPQQQPRDSQSRDILFGSYAISTHALPISPPTSFTLPASRRAMTPPSSLLPTPPLSSHATTRSNTTPAQGGGRRRRASAYSLLLRRHAELVLVPSYISQKAIQAQGEPRGRQRRTTASFTSGKEHCHRNADALSSRWSSSPPAQLSMRRTPTLQERWNSKDEESQSRRRRRKSRKSRKRKNHKKMKKRGKRSLSLSSSCSSAGAAGGRSRTRSHSFKFPSPLFAAILSERWVAPTSSSPEKTEGEDDEGDVDDDDSQVNKINRLRKKRRKKYAFLSFLKSKRREEYMSCFPSLLPPPPPPSPRGGGGEGGASRWRSTCVLCFVNAVIVLFRWMLLASDVLGEWGRAGRSDQKRKEVEKKQEENCPHHCYGAENSHRVCCSEPFCCCCVEERKARGGEKEEGRRRRGHGRSPTSSLSAYPFPSPLPCAGSGCSRSSSGGGGGAFPHPQPRSFCNPRAQPEVRGTENFPHFFVLETAIDCCNLSLEVYKPLKPVRFEDIERLERLHPQMSSATMLDVLPRPPLLSSAPPSPLRTSSPFAAFQRTLTWSKKKWSALRSASSTVLHAIPREEEEQESGGKGRKGEEEVEAEMEGKVAHHEEARGRGVGGVEEEGCAVSDRRWIYPELSFHGVPSFSSSCSTDPPPLSPPPQPSPPSLPPFPIPLPSSSTSRKETTSPRPSPLYAFSKNTAESNRPGNREPGGNGRSDKEEPVTTRIMIKKKKNPKREGTFDSKEQAGNRTDEGEEEGEMRAEDDHRMTILPMTMSMTTIGATPAASATTTPIAMGSRRTPSFLPPSTSSPPLPVLQKSLINNEIRGEKVTNLLSSQRANEKKGKGRREKAKEETDEEECLPAEALLEPEDGWMNVAQYGYLLRCVKLVKKVQFLIAVLDTSAPFHKGKPPRVVVAFRGTSRMSNVKKDSAFWNVPWAEAHPGGSGAGPGGGQRTAHSRRDSRRSRSPRRSKGGLAPMTGWETMDDDVALEAMSSFQTTVPMTNTTTTGMRGIETFSLPPHTPSTSSFAIPLSRRRERREAEKGEKKVEKEEEDGQRKRKSLSPSKTEDSLPCVHAGFLSLWNSLRTEVRKKLRLVERDIDTTRRRRGEESILTGGKEGGAGAGDGSGKGDGSVSSDSTPDLEVLLTGHSLGGALAVLCAYHLSRWFHWRGGKKVRLMVYTFGQPRVGNVAFEQSYLHYVEHSFQVTNESDLVSAVCNGFSGGTKVQIDRYGNYAVRPSPVEEVVEPLKGKGLGLVHHLLVNYAAALNAIADRSGGECKARVDQPYQKKQEISSVSVR